MPRASQADHPRAAAAASRPEATTAHAAVGEASAPCDGGKSEAASSSSWSLPPCSSSKQPEGAGEAASASAHAAALSKKSRLKRRSNLDKKGKGLRQFAIRVCEKVESKQLTSYNDVADELVHETLNPSAYVAPDREYDEKNIRRRVYDALNVLCAIGVIEKDRKAIRWKGLPRASEREMHALRQQVRARTDAVRDKTERLEQFEQQQRAFHALVQRNKLDGDAVSGGARGGVARLRKSRPRKRSGAGDAVHMPFIIVSTAADTGIEMEMEEHREACNFRFNRAFHVHDDREVLQRMGVGAREAAAARNENDRGDGGDDDGGGDDDDDDGGGDDGGGDDGAAMHASDTRRVDDDSADEREDDHDDGGGGATDDELDAELVRAAAAAVEMQQQRREQQQQQQQQRQRY